ncbi:hypothetical protein BGX26_012411, partial [Mortierella sp. AD094]
PIESEATYVPVDEQIQHSDKKRTGLVSIDLAEELKFTQERLEVIANEERTGADAEKVALEELQKSTESLISIRKELSEKNTQLSSLDETDSSRTEIQSEVDRLTLEQDEKEHQWSATKEVWRREFGPIEDNSSTAPKAEIKAKTEYDIKMLQDQITNLQKQLDAVSIRRKQMAAEAEEQQKRLAEQGGAVDDDEGDV